MRIVLVLVLMIAGARAASAASDPCAKFADADAYNNCLAGFGPVAAPHGLSRAPPDEVRPDVHGRAAARKSAPQTRRPQSRGRAAQSQSQSSSGPAPRPLPHGRMRMELMVPSRD